jgi:putative addiction module component (TIGR02574 family)
MLTKIEMETMPVDEKIELIGELWESIKSKEQWDDSVPLWQREILEQRLKHSLQHPEEARPVDEVMNEIRQKLRSRT